MTRPSLFPTDEALPTWLHTTLCILVAAPFSGFFLWDGFGALFTGHMEPIPGPEIGQYFFGEVALNGRSARLAGLTFVLIGLSQLALGFSFTRHAEGRPRWRLLPWVLLAVSLVFWTRVR